MYDEFAINAFDECFLVNTELITCEHKTIDDPANSDAKVVQYLIKIKEFDFTIALLMPVHQSNDWEIVRPSDDYSVGFYCILGELGRSFI